MFRRHLQGHPEGIDPPLVQQRVHEDGQRLRPVVGLMGKVAIKTCRGADGWSTVRHGNLLSSAVMSWRQESEHLR
jgi:hypothetical protein